MVSIARSELPGLDARIGYLDGDDDERPALEMLHGFTRMSGHKNALWLRTAR